MHSALLRSSLTPVLRIPSRQAGGLRDLGVDVAAIVRHQDTRG